MEPIKNAWYVASFSKDVTTKPKKQTVLNQPVVLYRTEAGEAAALDDRCPHRFAPLHQGKVIGDSIQCPYHGLQFNGHGQCSHNPHGDGKIPAAAKLRRYPLIEQDGLVWIWTGERAPASDEKPLDLAPFLNAHKLTLISGSFRLGADFELVLDNLMDLSHAAFLHPTTLANPDATDTLVFEMLQDGDSVTANHWLPKSKPSPQFQPFWTSDSPIGDGRGNIRWSPPSNLELDVGFTEVGGKLDDGVYLHVAHLLTPGAENETFYHWIAARNFCLGDDKVSEMMAAQFAHAFETEDEPMIQAVAENMGTNDLMSLKPVLLPSDAAAIRVRRMIGQLRDKERSVATAA